MSFKKQFSVVSVLGMTSVALATFLAGCGEKTDAINSEATHVGSHGAAVEECDITGTWALKFVVPVKWAGSIGVQGGSGEIVQWVKSQRTKSDGNVVNDELTMCGTTVPDYKSQAVFGNETYGIRFPDALFDSEVLPPAKVRTTVSSFVAGGTYKSEQVAIQLGVNLPNPNTDAWPKKSVDTPQVDMDKDGKPGVTIMAATGEGYSLPPVNMFRSKRATQFYIAARNIASSTGSITACNKFSGNANIPIIGGKLSLNSHVLGCLRTDGKDCSSAETALTDQFQPDYNLAGQATVTMVKVDPDTNCAAVRGFEF